MTIEYKEGPKDRPWEVVEEDYNYLYVQRVGRDNDPQRIRTEPSFALDRDGEPGREVAEHLRDLLNERDALADWSCEGCGARFAQAVRPEMLAGVTHCSKCVLADVLAAHLGRTRAALAALIVASEERRTAEVEWLDVHHATPAIGTPRLNAAELALISAELAAREVLQ